MRRIDSEDDIRDGLEGLLGADPRLARVIDQAGRVPLRRSQPGYAALTEIILGQMVSKASAGALWRKLQLATGGVTPEAILSLDPATARAAGLSAAKAATLDRVARAVVFGGLDLDRLCTVPAPEAMAALTSIKGVGPWTAEVYLLFCAGHVDIFPSGDVALQSAAAHALGLDGRPAPRALALIAEAWSPWRGVAARLLWAYYAAHMRRDAAPLAP
ncbi:DNA-3-methyladenine glycosylase II [Hoeflea marina]|uniref:DNA-3-methyladenine glycosylase II n=1 Tax=Hoeflea marina TaxID=274592 RepID=A0A317PEM0_9HYPH|nr:DNA-3-methyladenine glycosylase [Hoeflea marina]PWV98070.1 DNA-3-methyladenine glycosylase II [Hoeflea marina]